MSEASPIKDDRTISLASLEFDEGDGGVKFKHIDKTLTDMIGRLNDLGRDFARIVASGLKEGDVANFGTSSIKVKQIPEDKRQELDLFGQDGDLVLQSINRIIDDVISIIASCFTPEESESFQNKLHRLIEETNESGDFVVSYDELVELTELEIKFLQALFNSLDQRLDNLVEGVDTSRCSNDLAPNIIARFIMRARENQSLKSKVVKK